MTDKPTTLNNIEILIVGAGTMGAGIAQVYAQSGLVVGLLDITDEILDKAKYTIARELNSVRARKYNDAEIDAIKARVLYTTDYPTACAGKYLKLIIESATENIDIKLRIFRELDRLCAPHVVLATNSSSLDIDLLAKAVGRPDKVVWMHFFYLPHKNRAGEVAGADSASRESVETAMRYMKIAGTVVTPILSSRKGGAADVLFVALLLEACRMVDEGYAKADIEAAGGRAFGMPLGFLALMDATGLPVGLYAMDSFADDSNPDDPLYRVYKDFFKPTAGYRKLVERYLAANDSSTIRWLPPDGPGPGSGDQKLVTRLTERFLAVAFLVAFELVQAGVIAADELETLTQNAFRWRKGPFAVFNELSAKESLRIVRDRKILAAELGHHFPIPDGLRESNKEKRLH